MSITSFAPAQKDVAGFVTVTIGAGFANVAAPKLSELSLTITAAIDGGISPKMSVKTKSIQLYSEVTSREVFDSQTLDMPEITVFTDGTTDASFRTLVDDGKTLGIFSRPYTASATALAVADKGDAYNGVVHGLSRASAGIGDKWRYTFRLTDCTRSALGVALVA